MLWGDDDTGSIWEEAFGTGPGHTTSTSRRPEGSGSGVSFEGEMDQIFDGIRELLVFVLGVGLIVLLLSWAPAPHLREASETFHQIASGHCESGPFGRTIRTGFGDTFDGGTAVSSSWAVRRAAGAKVALSKGGRGDHLTEHLFHVDLPVASWQPLETQNGSAFDQLFPPETQIAAWVDADSDVTLALLSSPTSKKSLARGTSSKSNSTAANLQHFGYTSTVYRPSSRGTWNSPLQTLLSLYSQHHELLATAELIASMTTEPPESPCLCSHSLDLSAATTPAHSPYFVEHPTTRLWRLTDAVDGGTIGYLREFVQLQHWWLRTNRLAYGFQLFDASLQLVCCLRKGNSNSYYGLFRCSNAAEQHLPTKTSLKANPQQRLLEPPFVLLKRIEQPASRPPFLVKSSPWQISVRDQGLPESSAKAIMLALSRFVAHFETSSLSSAEGLGATKKTHS